MLSAYSAVRLCMLISIRAEVIGICGFLIAYLS